MAAVQAGNAVGELARRLRPEGRLIGHSDDFGVALEETRIALAAEGDITLFEIKLDNGAIIRVSRPNLSRHDQEDFSWDDRVSMHWRADSPVVLLS